MTVLRATARATRPSRVAFLHKQHFPDLLRELPSVAERLVWMMSDRVREFAVNETHREKLMALGKLSAGLAHELNNPAAAVQRAAAQLCTLLTDLQTHAAGAAASSLAERLTVDRYARATRSSDRIANAGCGSGRDRRASTFPGMR